MNLISNTAYNPTLIAARQRASVIASRDKKSDSFKIRSQAAQLIEDELLMRAYTVVKKEDGGIEGVPVVGIIYNEENHQKAKKYEACLAILKESLLSLARRSDATARIIQKFLDNQQCKFFIVEPDDMSGFGFEKETIAAVYYPRYKAIIIPASTLLREDSNSRDFQDVLLHECIHAFDDLLVLDTDPQKPAFYSNDAIKQRLKPFFSAELDKSKQMLETLREARIKRLTKQIKLSNSAATREEINNAIEKSFAERPLYRVHIHDSDETDVITKNTWCWYQTSGEYIVAPFIKCANDNLDADSAKDSIKLAPEYTAYALTFYLSADPAKRQRLRQFASDVCEYIETKLLPVINK